MIEYYHDPYDLDAYTTVVLLFGVLSLVGTAAPTIERHGQEEIGGVNFSYIHITTPGDDGPFWSGISFVPAILGLGIALNIPDEQIIESVTADITGRAKQTTCLIAHVDPVDNKTNRTIQ